MCIRDRLRTAVTTSPNTETIIQKYQNSGLVYAISLTDLFPLSYVLVCVKKHWVCLKYKHKKYNQQELYRSAILFIDYP